MSSIIPHLPTCLFPYSRNINSGVNGRLRVMITVEYKSMTSFYDSATTFGGFFIQHQWSKVTSRKNEAVSYTGLLKSCFLLPSCTRQAAAGVPLSFTLVGPPFRTVLR